MERNTVNKTPKMSSSRSSSPQITDLIDLDVSSPDPSPSVLNKSSCTSGASSDLSAKIPSTTETHIPTSSTLPTSSKSIDSDSSTPLIGLPVMHSPIHAKLKQSSCFNSGVSGSEAPNTKSQSKIHTPRSADRYTIPKLNNSVIFPNTYSNTVDHHRHPYMGSSQYHAFHDNPVFTPPTHLTNSNPGNYKLLQPKAPLSPSFHQGSDITNIACSSPPINSFFGQMYPMFYPLPTSPIFPPPPLYHQPWYQPVPLQAHTFHRS